MDVPVEMSKARGAVQRWLMSLPKDSLERLRAINLSTGSSKHIILCLAFGLYDKHIRTINRMITGLLLARLKAERVGQMSLVARINSFMDEMHAAVDLATGTGSIRQSNSAACSAPVRVHATSVR